MASRKPDLPKQAPAPVVNQSPIGDDLAPTLVTADEQDAKLKKKKVKKVGTSALNTTSGVNVGTTSGNLNIA